MSKTLSVDEIEKILASGDFDRLQGVIEDEWLDCKSEPYMLENDHQKLELAKDVSAFANAEGGLILLGVKTVKNSAHREDEIKDVRPFPQSLVDGERYQNILSNWIYPAFERVVIKWFPSASNSKKGIVAIVIPKQPTSKIPFLVTKTIDSKGKQKEVVFGYVERQRANAVPKSVEELHALIKDGGLYDSVNRKLEDLREAVERLGERQNKTLTGPSPEDLFKTRLEQVVAALELGTKHPTYVLAAYPMDEVEIPDLFYGPDAKTVKLLEHPPRIRARGFDLDTRETSRNHAGERRQALSRQDRCLSLWKDGTLVFAANGIDFLCWPSGGTRTPGLRINTLALEESTLEFCELSYELFQEVSQKPRKIKYLLHFRHMVLDGHRCSLIPHHVNSDWWRFGHNAKIAPDESGSFPVVWEGEINAGEVAFRLVSQVYEWFGFDDDKIPYTEKAGGKPVISGAEIRRLNP